MASIAARATLSCSIPGGRGYKPLHERHLKGKVQL
jgi:hypothetical protein